jgi:hypothetical protein
MQLNDFFEERLEIARSLTEIGDLSLLNTFNTDLPRIFVVATASHFETVVTGHIRDFFAETSHAHPVVMGFVDKRALFRNYHTLFSWNENSVNSFFSIFGKDCGDHYKLLANNQEWLRDSAKAFLRLGQARNELVHGDFASHSPTFTAPEIQQSFSSAQRFVDTIPYVLRLQNLPGSDEQSAEHSTLTQ